MSVALYVEGPSDKEVFKWVLRYLDAGGTPVRAGSGHLQGSGLLWRWQEVASLAPEEKLIFVFDRNKRAELQHQLRRSRPLQGKMIVLLPAPWRGIEEFVETHLDRKDPQRYRTQRSSRLHKRALAESFAPRVSRDKVRRDRWLQGTLLPCILRCDCPRDSVLGGDRPHRAAG